MKRGARRRGSAAALALAAVLAATPSHAFRASGSSDTLTQALAAAARLRSVAAPPSLVAAPAPPLEDALSTYFADVVGVGSPAAARAGMMRTLDALSPGYRRGLAMLLDAMSAAQRLRNRAFAGVTGSQIAFAEQVALRSRVAPGAVTAAHARAALGIIERIDMAGMLRAAGLVAGAARDAMPLFVAADAPAEPLCLPMRAVCVGSAGDDMWSEDAQLLVDPGGNDTYSNNAGGVFNAASADASGGCVLGGGTSGHARPNLDCSPAPSNVCTYDVANNATGRSDLPVAGLPGHTDPRDPDADHLNDGSCGSEARRDRLLADASSVDRDHDSRGVAVLLDAGGSDTYTVPWTHEDPVFGLIEDCYPGDESKVNTNRDFVQGSALSGIGLLWDAGDGDDAYRGRLNAQGSGHVGGVGMLVTTGSGNDTFWADRLSQASGIAGGVGLLVNAKDGDHSYLLDAPVVYRNEFSPAGRGCAQQGRAGQGEGGFAGAGVLWSRHSGHALYRAVTHVTSDAAPYAPIRDANDAPLLVGGEDAQGSGESFPIPDTAGGVVVGAGLLVDDTDSADTVCAPLADGTASSGMISGSGSSSGIDLSTRGAIAPCGTFNLAREIGDDVEAALLHLAAGALGVRVVL